MPVVASSFTGEIGNSTLDFAKFSPALWGGRTNNEFFTFFSVGDRSVHVGEKRAGANRVYCYSKWCELKCEAQSSG